MAMVMYDKWLIVESWKFAEQFEVFQYKDCRLVGAGHETKNMQLERLE